MKNFKFKGPWLKCWQKNAATLLYAIGVFCIFYSSAQAGPENGRIGYWTFDTVNIGKVEDISGHGLGGRLKGDVQLIEGKIGKALDFKDGTSYVEISHQNILNLSQEMSISLWFHPDSAPASYSVPILKKFTTTADAQVALYYFGATSTNPGSVAVYGNAGGAGKFFPLIMSFRKIHGRIWRGVIAPKTEGSSM